MAHYSTISVECGRTIEGDVLIEESDLKEVMVIEPKVRSFRNSKIEQLERNQNKNNCLVSNFYNKLKSPALFSHLFRTEKSAENFNLLYKLLIRQLSSF